MYDFTACIVTYNTNREDLSQIISCFQKTKLKFKLWISDNSEEDSLRSFINNFSDDRIEYIFNNSNNGFGSGHNVVLKKLMDNNFKEKAEFHIILNADITFEENTIEKMVDFTTPREKIDYTHGVNEASGLDISKYGIDDADKLLKHKGAVLTFMSCGDIYLLEEALKKKLNDE